MGCLCFNDFIRIGFCYESRKQKSHLSQVQQTASDLPYRMSLEKKMSNQ
jgi:hypothetical protein